MTPTSITVEQMQEALAPLYALLEVDPMSVYVPIVIAEGNITFCQSTTEPPTKAAGSLGNEWSEHAVLTRVEVH